MTHSHPEHSPLLPPEIVAAVELTEPDIEAGLASLDEAIKVLPAARPGELAELGLHPETIAEDTVAILFDE